MARTTATAVREVIDTNLEDRQINAFITDASLWVTEELASEEEPQSAERLEIIERYLTCALIRLRDLGLKDVKLDQVSENYQVDPETTDYLLRAAAFDKSGKLRTFFLGAVGGAGAVEVPKPIKFKVGSVFADEEPRTD